MTLIFKELFTMKKSLTAVIALALAFVFGTATLAYAEGPAAPAAKSEGMADGNGKKDEMKMEKKEKKHTKKMKKKAAKKEKKEETQEGAPK